MLIVVFTSSPSSFDPKSTNRNLESQIAIEITVVAAKIEAEMSEMIPKLMFGVPLRQIREASPQKNAHPGNP